MHFEQIAHSDTISFYQVSSVQSPTALQLPNKTKAEDHNKLPPSANKQSFGCLNYLQVLQKQTLS